MRIRIKKGPGSEKLSRAVGEYRIRTVCVRAACPNSSECWGQGHLTVLVLGDVCTRDCRFCNITERVPDPPDSKEPERVGRFAKSLSLEYLVVTSPTRDDLPDEGSGHLARTVASLRTLSPGTDVELLIPDLSSRPELLSEISRSGARVIGHNIELVSALYPRIRPRADYARSMRTLEYLGRMKLKSGFYLKTAMILGFGEKREELIGTFKELISAGVDTLYLGQYLAPTARHYPVKKYYTEEEFNDLGRRARGLGFKTVLAGPLVRSSYKARDNYKELLTVSGASFLDNRVG